MATRRSAALPESRVRTLNLMIRLSERERAMLNAVAEHEQLNASETVRMLVRRAHDQQEAAGAKPKPKRSTAKEKA